LRSGDRPPGTGRKRSNVITARVHRAKHDRPNLWLADVLSETRLHEKLLASGIAIADITIEQS
jgi:hypothetical protein